MVSEQAHYCVDRAARIMGWGDEGIIKIPTDARYKMRTELLEEYYQTAKEKGIQVIAVVGSACSTATGSYDDLEAIGAFCEEKDLWFHVDGAHGGAAIFSEKYKHLVQGIHRADSVIMDFHKMLMVPAVTTGLFFRDGDHSYQTFSLKVDYLFSRDQDREWHNIAKRSFECTKLMMSLKVYQVLKPNGFELFDAYVTKVLDTGRRFAKLVELHPNLEFITPPEANIVCFRYIDPALDQEENNLLNQKIRQALLEEGEYYIVQTQLNGIHWLRCTFSNPFTGEDELKGLLKEVVKLGDAELQTPHGE